MSDPFGLRTNERALEETFLRLQLRCGLGPKPSVACANLVKLTPILSLIDSLFKKDDLEEELIQHQGLLDFLGSLISEQKTKKSLRRSAIYLLAFIEAGPLLPVLKPILSDRDKDIVLETIRSIASIGSPEAFETLINFSQHEKDKKKRLEFLRNVSQFDLVQTDLFVEENLHSNDKETLKAALEATHGILYSRTSNRLLKSVENIVYQLLVDENQPVDMRRLALEIIVLAKPSGAVDYLIEALNNLAGNPLSEEIVLSLEEFDDQRIPEFLESIVTSPDYSEDVKQTAYSLMHKQHE
ncbi:MAG: HEAT repeat domain-containing protein [Candidatus Odinarchaeota archaeon]